MQYDKHFDEFDWKKAPKSYKDYLIGGITEDGKRRSGGDAPESRARVYKLAVEGLQIISKLRDASLDETEQDMIVRIKAAVGIVLSSAPDEMVSTLVEDALKAAYLLGKGKERREGNK